MNRSQLTPVNGEAPTTAWLMGGGYCKSKMRLKEVSEARARSRASNPTSRLSTYDSSPDEDADEQALLKRRKAELREAQREELKRCKPRLAAAVKAERDEKELQERRRLEMRKAKHDEIVRRNRIIQSGGVPTTGDPVRDELRQAFRRTAEDHVGTMFPPLLTPFNRPAMCMQRVMSSAKPAPLPNGGTVMPGGPGGFGAQSAPASQRAGAMAGARPLKKAPSVKRSDGHVASATAQRRGSASADAFSLEGGKMSGRKTQLAPLDHSGVAVDQQHAEEGQHYNASADPAVEPPQHAAPTAEHDRQANAKTAHDRQAHDDAAAPTEAGKKKPTAEHTDEPPAVAPEGTKAFSAFGADSSAVVEGPTHGSQNNSPRDNANDSGAGGGDSARRLSSSRRRSSFHGREAKRLSVGEIKAPPDVAPTSNAEFDAMATAATAMSASPGGQRPQPASGPQAFLPTGSSMTAHRTFVNPKGGPRETSPARAPLPQNDEKNASGTLGVVGKGEEHTVTAAGANTTDSSRVKGANDSTSSANNALTPRGTPLQRRRSQVSAPGSPGVGLSARPDSPRRDSQEFHVSPMPAPPV